MSFDFTKIKVKNPNRLKFGTAGIPLSTPDRNTPNGVKYLKELGLSAMELEFVRSVNLNDDSAAVVNEAREKDDVTLTCHGSYFINLNAKEPKKIGASISRVLKACDIARKAGAWSMTFHAAYYLKMEKEVVYNQVKTQMKKIISELKDSGNEIWVRPETTGKPTQWGDYKEIIRLSQDVDQVMPCVDFAHLHARTNGKYNTLEEFRKVLMDLEKGLGREALDNMHIHLSGIEYGAKGERHHLYLDDSDMNYPDLFKALKEFKVKGALISESPNLEKDAKIMKKTYEEI
ncbi:MAG: TIM barrel protein [Candidatus Woesearchaeota archaeon]